jgi:hypothetical protein
MAIYKLTPLDPTDSVWRHFPFVEPVYINARDEHAARQGVSAAAHKMNPALTHALNSWPWVYSARCTIDDLPEEIACGEVRDARGRPMSRSQDL